MGNQSRLLLAGTEDVKNFLGKPDGDVADDDLIYDMVRSTSDLIEHFCDRKFSARIYKEYYQGDGSNKLLLRQFPIVSIGGLTDASTVASGEMIDDYGNVTQVVNQALGIWDDVSRVFGSNTQKPQSEIIISNQIPGLIQLMGDIFINSKLWSFYNVENILVIYQAGYLEIPYKLKMACVQITALEYARSKGLISSIEWEKDPAKMKQDSWDDIAQFRREM